MPASWSKVRRTMTLTSEWVSLFCETWQQPGGEVCEYWRVEKADSVIVLPIQAGHILCVAPTFRPGVSRATLDLPGGRLPSGKTPHEIVPVLLQRELGIGPEAIRRTEALNSVKWVVNSSFSNQGLWAFVAEIDEAFSIPQALIGAKTPADAAGLEKLMERLDCLQCRAVLREWQQRKA